MIIALTGEPPNRRRYINPKIEEELVDFKKEIEEKFAKSRIRTYKFPLKNTTVLPDSLRNSVIRYEDIDEPTFNTIHKKKNNYIKTMNEPSMHQSQFKISDSPKLKNSELPSVIATNEKNRYQDIMRSINSTEQFIKANQAKIA